MDFMVKIVFLTLFIMGYFDQNLKFSTWIDSFNGSFKECTECVLVTEHASFKG